MEKEPTYILVNGKKYNHKNVSLLLDENNITESYIGRLNATVKCDSTTILKFYHNDELKLIAYYPAGREQSYELEQILFNRVVVQNHLPHDKLQLQFTGKQITEKK